MNPANSMNPYESGGASSNEAAVAAALYTSKAIGDEIRRDDAAMAEELTALVPRSRLANAHRGGSTAGGTRSSGDMMRSALSATGAGGTHAPSSVSHSASSSRRKGGSTLGGGRGSTAAPKAATVQVRENASTEAFIEKTREVGLARMSLAAKKSEIRKLEEDMDRAEKRLRQRQEQLASTREKFNSFLKYSNLEQDAAVRRADSETKAKQEKVVEIKKLSARINHIETDIRKAELQLESCRAYKSFLDSLTKPQWFYDVLIGLRTLDRTEELLLDTEDAFEKQSAQVTEAYHVAVAAREAAVMQQQKDRMSFNTPRQSIQDTTLRLDDGLPPEVIPLQEQLATLENDLGLEAQRRVDEETARIKEEVEDMTIDEVRHHLNDDYPEDRIPMYFRHVDELLEVFINVEEGNLFLIQNCQELEEELENVAMAHLTETTDTEAMTSQRHAQMEVLSEKIKFAQEKVGQLDDRAAALNRHVTISRGANPGDNKTPGVPGSSSGASGANAAAGITPEEYRGLLEAAIGGMFRTLNGGDTAIKQLTAQQQRLAQRKAEAEESANNGDPSSPHRPGSGEENAEADKSATGTQAGSLAGTVTKKKVRSNAGPKSGKGTARKTPTPQPQAATASANSANSNDAGANMGAVELLTIVENKLQEYHRYITDPANGVDEALIVAVMKASDKERRREARLEHMAKQAAEHEERSRRALERSQAPVVRRMGKPVLRRSHAPTDGSDAMGGGPHGRGSDGRKSMAGSRIDDDGAEFFR